MGFASMREVRAESCSALTGKSEIGAIERDQTSRDTSGAAVMVLGGSGLEPSGGAFSLSSSLESYPAPRSDAILYVKSSSRRGSLRKKSDVQAGDLSGGGLWMHTARKFPVGRSEPKTHNWRTSESAYPNRGRLS